MKKRILIVEDEQALVKGLKLQLEDSYDVFMAMDGKQGLDMAATHLPDLILMDITMPEMDGLEVLKRLKEDNATATIPVILLTAKVEVENIYRGYKIGADYYITKPFSTTQLMNGISLFLEIENTEKAEMR